MCSDGLTYEGSKASDKCESSKAGSEQVEAAHLDYGGGGDGAPGGEEGAEHDADDDEAPVGSTVGHRQGSHAANTCTTLSDVKNYFFSPSYFLPSATKVTTRALTPGRSVSQPDRIRQMVLEMPTMEMRKEALTSVMPLEVAREGRNM